MITSNMYYIKIYCLHQNATQIDLVFPNKNFPRISTNCWSK